MTSPFRAKRTIGAAVLAIVIAGGVGGCAGLLDSDEPAERVYWLEPYLIAAPDVLRDAQSSLSLSVVAAPGLDTDRLLILEPDARLNHYAAARWPDNIPDVIQSHLQATLESTGQFSRVTAGPTSRAAHRRLELEIREIYTVSSGAKRTPVVRMTLGGYVSCSDTDDALMLATDAGIEGDRLSSIVAAYQNALEAVSRQLVRQLRESCSPEASAASDRP